MCAGGQEADGRAFNATTPSGASGATDTTTAPSATWRQRAASVTTTGADTSIGIYDALKTTAGATGNLTATASLGAGHVVIAGAFKIRPPSLADAWNIGDKSFSLALSNSDKTVTSTVNSVSGVRSTQVYTNGTAGKYYAEFLVNTYINSTEIGMLLTSSGLTATTGWRVLLNSGDIRNSGTVVGSVGSALASSDVLCMAWDAGAKVIWFRKNGGNWNNDAAADPAAGTNGIAVTGSAGNYALHMLVSLTGGVVTVRTELAEYTQTVPSGFLSWMGEGGGPTAYTLPAVAGTYALTGTAATPKLARVLDAATAGSYALAGTDATLTKGAAVIHYTLPAAAGSYALSGATAGLYRGREVLAVAGAYAVSGATASLEVGREVAADPGSYALSGATVSLELGKEVLALAGSYAITGTIATLRHGWKIAADGSSYALTGTATSLERGREVDAVAGSYAITGTAAAFARTWKTVAIAGSYSITGTPANLLRVGARAIIGLPGSYALSGAAVSLEYGREVAAGAGSYALTGTATSLERGREVDAVAGSYALTGAATTFRRSWKTVAVSGSYTVSGTPANLLRVGAYAIIGLPGAYALSGTDAILEKSSALAVASLAFDATATKGLGGFGTETFSLTVAEAAGQERLVFLAAITNGSTAEITGCTIDGQTATRVGTLVQGSLDIGGNRAIITAWRAPGTASTSINVVATITKTLSTPVIAPATNCPMPGRFWRPPASPAAIRHLTPTRRAAAPRRRPCSAIPIWPGQSFHGPGWRRISTASRCLATTCFLAPLLTMRLPPRHLQLPPTAPLPPVSPRLSSRSGWPPR